jgi:hypothetical protein
LAVATQFDQVQSSWQVSPPKSPSRVVHAFISPPFGSHTVSGTTHVRSRVVSLHVADSAPLLQSPQASPVFPMHGFTVATQPDNLHWLLQVSLPGSPALVVHGWGPVLGSHKSLAISHVRSCVRESQVSDKRPFPHNPQASPALPMHGLGVATQLDHVHESLSHV